MKTIFFGRLDPTRRKPLRHRESLPRISDGAFDTANGTALLTPDWDKGNDDKDSLRSSLGLDDHRHPAAE